MLVTVCFFLQCALGTFQGAQAAPGVTNAPSQNVATNLTPVGLADISGQAEASFSEIHSIDTQANSDVAVDDIEQKLPSLEEEIGARSEENARILAHGSSLELFGRLEGGWRGLSQELGDWNRTLKRRAQQLEASTEHLQQVQKRWELTREAEQNKVPQEVSDRMTQVVEGARKSTKDVQDELAKVLKLQSRVTEQGARVKESMAAIDQARQQIMRHLLIRDSPALWSGEVRSSETQHLAAQSQSSLARQYRELRSYWARKRERLIIQVLVFCGLAILLSRAHRRLAVRSLTQEDLEPTARSLGAPGASSLLMSLLLSPWLYDQAPRLWWSLLGMVALVPAIIVLRRLLARPLYGLINVLAAFYLLDQLRSVAAAQPLLWRLLFLTETGVGCLYCWILLKGRAVAGQDARPRFARVAGFVLQAAMALFALAFLANIAGYGRFSSLVGNLELSASYLAVVLFAVTRVAEATLRVILRATPVAEFSMVRRREPTLELWTRKTVGIAAAFAWFLFVIQRLSLRGSFSGIIWAIVNTPLALGSWHFTMGHVLMFAFVLWVAFAISRVLRLVLEEEVYGHFRLAPGLHYSISKALHYLILLLGFLVGLGMLGVDLTKLTIVAGAFGVGLGFGLQNIVNNFVSGIILLFERPVKVGDVVQLEGGEGVVRRIGIRASIVRTTSGSEIIVPNAKLISDPVTNWTFSQRRRLITMPISVASETEPRKVMDLLRKVAGGHPQVSKEGQVQALLTKLNDGTANYELRAWTDQSENWEQVRSDLFMSIKSSLAAEGIAMR